MSPFAGRTTLCDSYNKISYVITTQACMAERGLMNELSVTPTTSLSPRTLRSPSPRENDHSSSAWTGKKPANYDER